MGWESRGMTRAKVGAASFEAGGRFKSDSFPLEQ